MKGTRNIGTKKIIAIAALMMLCIYGATAQAVATNYSLISSFPVKANSISVDNFGNFYAVGNNQVVKFDKLGNKLQTYEEVKYGKIGSIDISNPLKIVLYYPDFMQAVLLDRFLAYFTAYNFLTSAIRM